MKPCHFSHYQEATKLYKSFVSRSYFWRQSFALRHVLRKI